MGVRGPAVGLEQALRFVARTDPGRVREQNEDTVLEDSRLGMAIVADGLGGHEGGEVASLTAANAILRHIENMLPALVRGQTEPESGLRHETLLLREAVQLANHAVYVAAREHSEYRRMGSTVISALFSDNKVSLAHVGDSRAYLLREGELRRLTTDHSVVQEFVSAGLYNETDARATFNKNLVTRALGADAQVVVDVRESHTAVGDLYLFCSDGLTDMLPDSELEAVLRERGSDPTEAADHLVRLANDAGGIDNISVVLVEVLRSFAADSDWQSRLVRYFDPR